MKNLKSLSIFFPSLNDAKSLPYLIAKTYQTAKKLTREFEIIVINDGSTDDTKEIIQSLQRIYKNLRLVNHPKNSGYGGAVISGFKHARKDWIFYTDGDGQYDPSDLSKLVKKMSSKTTVVNGYKMNRGDGLLRNLIGKTYNGILQSIFVIPISDIDCDFRLIYRPLLKRIKLAETTGIICLELTLKLKAAGAHFKEVPVHHFPRIFGLSQFFKFKHLWPTFTNYLRFFYQYRKYARFYWNR